MMKKRLIAFFLPILLLIYGIAFAACENDSPASLSAPQSLRIIDDVLYWDKVENAEGYTVAIDGKEYAETECRFDLTVLNNRNTYRIRVYAYRQNDVSSEASEIEYAGKCAVPTQGLHFEKIAQKDEYTVTKFAADEQGTCIVPSMYQGKKVTSVSPDTQDPGVEKVKHLYLPFTFDAFGNATVKNNFKKFCNLQTIDIEKKNANSQYFSEGNCIVNRSSGSLSIGCIGSIIPEGVKEISMNAFSGISIKSISMPDTVKYVSQGAFADCALLSEVKFSAELENIAFDAFKHCTALSNISLPEKLKSIWACAFEGCAALKAVEIPNGVNDAGVATFRDCTSLKSAKLSENMTAVGLSLFSGCVSLREIIIPRKITKIEEGAFKDCPLEEIFYIGTPEDWSKIEIKEMDNETFLSATRYYYSEEAPISAGSYWHYVNGVPAIWN